MTPTLWVLGLGPWLLGEGDFGIAVEAGTPDALCPAIEVTREAIRSRVGTVDVPGGGHWKALYTIVRSPGTERGDQIRLELRDPAGELKLQRELPIASETCATLAQILALVIERYFRDLSQSAPPDTEVAPARAEPQTPAPERESAARAAASVERDTAPLAGPPRESAAPPHRPSFALGVFSGVSSVTSSAGAGVGAFLRLGSVLRLRGQVWAPFGRQEQRIGGGSLSLTEFPARVAVLAGLDVGPVELELGPELLLAFERGAASGLSAATSGLRLAPGLGLQAAATYWLNPRIGIEFGLSADFVAADLTREFFVAGREVLEPDAVRGLLRVGIDFAVFP